MLNFKISQGVENLFRQTLGEQRGAHKGAIRAALEEALWIWTNCYTRGFEAGRQSQMRKELERLRSEGIRADSREDQTN